jgi:putative acetyltransferase
MTHIRDEALHDVEAIRRLNTLAFGQSQEADIVDRLRRNCDELLSLVAVKDDRVVGHILFSPVTIEKDDRRIKGAGLAPMAVLPEYQRQGIGSELVKAGIERLRNMDCPFVIVLGHPEYYSRFGFELASRYGIESDWDFPDEAFMVLVLDEVRMRGVSDVATYRSEFAEEV